MKAFLIIGNLNAVTYKQVFPLIKAWQVRLGVSIHSGDREFEVTDNYPLEAAGCRVGADGRKFIRVKGVRWFTTLEHDKHNPPISLTKRYDPANYPKYDNYDAIEVSRTEDIPCDYDGVMGVPVSFLDKWCPEQFEIVDAENRPEIRGGQNLQEVNYPKNWGVCPSFRLGGRQTYRRILIKRK